MPESRADSERFRRVVLVLAALAAGILVSGSGAIGPAAQIVVILGLGVVPPALVLFAARPDVALACYLLILPLAMPGALVGALNGGEILTAGVLLFGVASLWQARRRIEPAVRSLGALVWPLAGLALVGLVSLLVNGVAELDEIIEGLFKSLACAGVAVLVHMHASNERRVTAMLHAIAAGATLVALYAVIAYALGWSYSELYDVNRASGTMGDYNTFGGYMVLTSGTTLGLAAVPRRAGVKMLLVLSFLLQLVAMLLSLTLGSLVALAGGAVIALIFVVRARWTTLLLAGTMALMGVAVVIATNADLQEKLTRIDERTLDRVRSYQVGVAMFRDKFLLGFGTQSEVIDALWYGEADYGLTGLGASSSVPHNSLLMIGVEKGALGVLFFVLLIVGLLRLLLRQRATFRDSRYALLYAGVVVSVLGFMIQDLVNNLILHARLSIIFFAVVALTVRLAEVERSRTGENGART